jgi:hypothetical protein
MNTLRPAPHYAAALAPAPMRAAAEPVRTRFGTSFASLTYFDTDLLGALHSHGGDDLPPGITVASGKDPSIIAELDVITTVANLPEQSRSQRVAYLDALLGIYRRLPVDLTALASGDVLCVGPLREGRQIALALDCLPDDRSLTPSAKRIAYQEGILVGMSEIPAATPYRSCLVIDGVVASGATVMALLQVLPSTVEQITLVTAQSTAAGVWALYRYAALLGKRLDLIVGHVSGVLDGHFYAVDPDDRERLVLGDIGDTISMLAEPDSTVG